VTSKRAAAAPDHAEPDHDPAHDTEERTYTVGSGNVFADLGLPDAEERLAKAQLAMRIHDAITARGISQAEAAKLLGVDQAKVSHIVRGRLSGFTMDRLFRYLGRLGCQVDIVVHPVAPRRTKTRPSLQVITEVEASGPTARRQPAKR